MRFGGPLTSGIAGRNCIAFGHLVHSSFSVRLSVPASVLRSILLSVLCYLKTFSDALMMMTFNMNQKRI